MKVRLGDVLRECKRRGISFSADQKTIRNILKDLEAPSDYLYTMRSGLQRTFSLINSTFDTTDSLNMNQEISIILKKISELIIAMKKLKNKVEYKYENRK